jgi:hypothetical protein
MLKNFSPFEKKVFSIQLPAEDELGKWLKAK